MSLLQIKSNKRIGEILFFISVSCLFFLSLLTYLNPSENHDLFGYDAYLEFFSLWRVLKPLFLVLLFVKIILFSDYSRNKLIAISAFLVSVFWICRTYHPNYFLLYAFAACFAASGISFRKIAKIHFYLSVATLCLAFIFLCYGLTLDNVVQRGSIARHSFGLVHPNSFGMWSMLILLYYTLYKQDDLKTPHFIWFSVQAVAVFILTNSRASFILSVMLIISSVAIKAFNSKYRRTYMSLLFIAILSLAVIWFILVLVYDPDISILDLANRLTSGRVRLSHDALSDYPPSMFGSNITFPYYVDPLYTYTLVIYGFFGLISFLLMFYKGAFRSFKQELPFMLISILIFQLYNTQENVFLYHLMDITMYSAACQLE